MNSILCTIPGMARKRLPEGEKKDETVSAKITATELAQLERLAADDDRTLSYIVAKALREYLERHPQPPASRGKR